MSLFLPIFKKNVIVCQFIFVVHIFNSALSCHLYLFVQSSLPSLSTLHVFISNFSESWYHE